MRRPNILFVIADQHTGYAMSPEAPVATPSLDRLAAEGLRFTQMRTPLPLCAPARASLMSSLYPHAHGMWNNNHTPAAIRRDLWPQVCLWPQLVAESGYRVGYAGKWSLSAERGPSAFGMEELAAPRGRGAKGTLVDALSHQRPGWPPRLISATTTAPHDSLPDARTTAAALEWIDARSGSPDPWCLFVAWTNPHDPYVAPTEFMDLYRGVEIPRPAGCGDDLRDKPNIYRRLQEQLWSHLEWPQVADVIRHYYAAISFLDGQLGRLVSAVDRSGRAADTIIIYTADHGDYAGAHGLFCKGVPAFDQAYRVPFVLRWPAGLRAPGRSVDAFSSLLDVGPTLLEAAAAPPLGQVHGRSLAPFLAGQPVPEGWPDAFHGEFLGHENLYTQRSVRTRTHKYVWNAFDYDELYDLKCDPDETVNRAADPAYEGVKRALIARLWAWGRETGDFLENEYPMNALLPYGPRMLEARG